MHRSEHWLVTKGVACVFLDEKIKTLKTGMSIDIPKSQSITYIIKQKLH